MSVVLATMPALIVRGEDGSVWQAALIDCLEFCREFLLQGVLPAHGRVVVAWSAQRSAYTNMGQRATSVLCACSHQGGLFSAETLSSSLLGCCEKAFCMPNCCG